jgi:hypothetical protein
MFTFVPTDLPVLHRENTEECSMKREGTQYFSNMNCTVPSLMLGVDPMSSFITIGCSSGFTLSSFLKCDSTIHSYLEYFEMSNYI